MNATPQTPAPQAPRAALTLARTAATTGHRPLCEEHPDRPGIVVWVNVGPVRTVSMWFCSACAPHAEAEVTEDEPKGWDTATCRADGSEPTVDHPRVLHLNKAPRIAATFTIPQEGTI